MMWYEKAMTDFSTATTTYRHPRGLRWQCNGCAKCCSSGLAIGPVEPDVVQGLQQRNIEEQWPRAREGWFNEQQAPDGSTQYFFRLRDGRCVFLREDNLCAIHALLGPEAKPGFCREFPYHFVQDAHGISAVIRPACGSFFEGFQRDDEVGPELARVHALPRVVPHRRWSPAHAVVLPGKAVAAESWLRVEEALLERLAERDEPPTESVAYVRHTLCAILDVSLPPAVTQHYEGALDALLTVLARVLEEQRNTSRGYAPDHRRRFLEQSLERIQSAGANGAAPWDHEEQAYANMLLRSFLLSKGFANWGGLPEGLGVFLMGLEIAHRASVDEKTSFGEHLAEWVRLRDNQMIRALLLRASSATRDLFLHSGGT